MRNRFYLVVFSMFALALFCASAYAGTLSGAVAFTGTAPAVEKLKTDADPKCKMMHPDGLDSDSVIVNANGTLKNVFVYVKSGLEGKKFEAPKEPILFDQHGCAYKPKVFGIQTGQQLEILNSDDTLHNVHALSANSPQFNLGMPIKGMKVKKSFAKPEVMVKIKCEVHPWMAAYVGVLDHPFFAVSDDQGKFEIKDLPAGKYTIEAWHEKFGVQTQEIEVADAPAEAKFEYKSA